MRALLMSAVGVAALTISACDGSTTTTANTTSSTTPSSAQAVSTADSHNYSLKDGDAYGYTAAVSQNDLANGQGAAEVTFVRYAGEKGGTYYVMDGKKDGSEYYSCQKPCKYVKEALLDGSDEKTMEAAPGVMATSIFEDAQTGKLAVSHTAVTELASKVDLSNSAK